MSVACAAPASAKHINNMDVSVDLDHPSGVESQLISCAQAVLPGWRDTRGVTVSEVAGGITNKLWKLTPPEEGSSSGLEAVLIRVYGQGTDFFIDRSRELRVMARVNDNGFGCKVLGTFANGRFEQYLVVKNLEAPEMLYPSVARAIAARLAAFHALRAPSGEEEDTSPTLLTTTRKWFAKAMALDFSDQGPAKQASYERLGLSQRLQEFEDLASLGHGLAPPVVFGHNDLLSGNVLVQREYELSASPDAPEPHINFIDFEYASYTYRGFDIGNHFNECAGFDCKWEDYPDEQQASRFCEAYLRQQLGRQPSPGEVERCVVEAHLYALVSHVYWAVWAVLQARWSSVDFDYLQYSHKRWARYEDTREAACKAAEELLQQAQREGGSGKAEGGSKG